MYTLDRKGRRLPKKLAGSPVEVKTAGRDFCWNAVWRIRRGAAASVHCTQVGGGTPPEAAGNRRLVEEAVRAPGLERWPCHSNGTLEDLGPAASGKAQPREAPLEVEVVQLQESQLALLAI